MKNLSREELKNVFGGLVAVPKCKSGSACTVTFVSSTGHSYTAAGGCEMVQSGTNVACWCNATSNETELTSNGGFSKCWA